MISPKDQIDSLIERIEQQAKDNCVYSSKTIESLYINTDLSNHLRHVLISLLIHDEDLYQQIISERLALLDFQQEFNERRCVEVVKKSKIAG